MSKKLMEDRRLVEYGFWKYYTFPYLLGGKITKWHKEWPGPKYAQVAGYSGISFLIDFALPEKEGRELVEDLKMITFAYREEAKVMHDQHKLKVKNLILRAKREARERNNV